VAFLGAMYGLGSILTNYVDGRVSDARNSPELSRLHREVDSLDGELKRAQKNQVQLTRELQALGKSGQLTE
jgi:hypothetical protein